MLAVARALGSRPKVLLIDEMSLGLAPIIVERLLPLIRKAADEFDTAVLLVEQHVGLALQIVDRALVINHGRVVLEGSGPHLRDNPELLAEGYLGESAGAGSH
jgi:branched-chain amino acid transport system ATP-binding protein